jgi:hypothetical protein
MKTYNGLRIGDGRKWAEWVEEDRIHACRLEEAWYHGGRLDFPDVSRHTAQQAMYVAMRLDGVAHSLAEMLALRRPPQSKTDREFLMGCCNGNQFEGREREGEYYKAVAEAHGQSVKGKKYLSSLARFPGDPEAWVDGRGDVERVLDKHGWGCDGTVKREVRNVGEPGGGPAVAPHLVEEEVAGIVAGVDDPDSVDVVDLAEQVFNVRKGPSKDAFEPKVHCPTFAAAEEV